MRKQWEKPDMAVLVRGRPEEAVMTICKMASSGPVVNQTWCLQTASCTECSYAQAS